jgi:hypothetical protein
LVDTNRESDGGQRTGFWRQYGLVAYWLLFAVFTIDAGRYSGIVYDPRRAPYPWAGVVTTWVDLALEVALLGRILRPRTFQRSWGRLTGALAVYAILGVSNGVTLVTDLPAYSYVPSQFHMVTFVGLFIVALVMAARSPRTEPG